MTLTMVISGISNPYTSDIKAAGEDNTSMTKNVTKTVKINKNLTAKVSFGDVGCWIQKMKVSKTCKKVVVPDKIEGSPFALDNG